MTRVSATTLLGALFVCVGVSRTAAAERPHILVISVDTLRADRMGSYGYGRDTSPNIDRLMAEGVRFADARTVAPLTSPAMTSMLTGLEPHDHGATRNGLRMRRNLASFSRLLARRGYETAAFVGNWTLKDKLSGLGEHFDVYQDVLEQRRWFGLAKREADGSDLSRDALQWLDEHIDDAAGRPFLLWVHYIEPHAPYHLQKDFLEQIDVKRTATFFSASRRYDSEIAFVDAEIGRLLGQVRERVPTENLLVIFVGDHGESLGDHGYWGHGRHLYDVSLRVPMGVAWPGTVPAGQVEEEPAVITDLAPTVVSLAGLAVPGFFGGFDWAPVLTGAGKPLPERVIFFQSHKSAVQPKENLEKLRQKGLLEVGRVVAGKKEIYRVPTGKRREFDLTADAGEKKSLVRDESDSSPELRAWLEVVQAGLAAADDLPPPSLSEDDVKALRALGYVD